VAAAAGGDESGLGALADQPGFVFGHQGEHAEDEFAVGTVVVSMIPLVSDCTPYPAAFEGGDDVDEVAQVPAEPVDFPDDQGVAGLVGLMRMSMAVGSPDFR
jgi:hypothetical protein